MPLSLTGGASATELTHGGRDWSIVHERDGFGGRPTPGGDAYCARAAARAARARPAARRTHRAPRAPGPRLAGRNAPRAGFSLLAANLPGAVVVFVLGNWVVPFPKEGSTSSNITANVIGFCAVMVVGLVLGTVLSTRVGRDAQAWLLDDRTPTPTERLATLRFP